MIGTKVIASADPKGKFDEGIITDTSKPGTCMELVPGTAKNGGRGSFRARSVTAGAKGPICVLLEDDLQGKLITDAYVANTRGRLYWPLPGEELNMLVKDVAGTGDVITTGTTLFGVNNTGTLTRDSSYASAPFLAFETAAALTADAHFLMKFMGSFA